MPGAQILAILTTFPIEKSILPFCLSGVSENAILTYFEPKLGPNLDFWPPCLKICENIPLPCKVPDRRRSKNRSNHGPGGVKGGVCGIVNSKMIQGNFSFLLNKKRGIFISHFSHKMREPIYFIFFTEKWNKFIYFHENERNRMTSPINFISFS